MNASELENCRRDSEKLLVLLAGQSNMAGRDYAGPDDLMAIPNLLMIRPDGKWQPAIEPITKDRAFVGTCVSRLSIRMHRRRSSVRRRRLHERGKTYDKRKIH